MRLPKVDANRDVVLVLDDDDGDPCRRSSLNGEKASTPPWSLKRKDVCKIIIKAIVVDTQFRLDGNMIVL
jgi:hypothetical protein